MNKTAFLVDGDFFIRRYQRIKGRQGAADLAGALFDYCLSHLKKLKRPNDSLYRILFYDCTPLDKKVHNPVSKEVFDYKQAPGSLFRNDLHRELVKKRKVALRLGRLSEQGNWLIKASKVGELLNHKIEVKDLEPQDVYYQVQQKGVDMRIGLDIASLSYKRLVDQIVLISGDSDFIPVAKHARREGIDVILDPMWWHVKQELLEHVDGLQTLLPKPPR